MKIEILHPRTGKLMASFEEEAEKSAEFWRETRIHTLELRRMCKRKTGFLQPKIRVTK